MTRLLAAGLFALTAAGCSKVPYVTTFDGNWAGTASAQGGAALVMVASFKWNEEKEYLSGTVDLDGWVYDLYTVASDKDSADITLVHNVGARSLTMLEIIQDEDSLDGNFEIDVCYNATLGGTVTGGQGQNCITPGSFDLSRQ